MKALIVVAFVLFIVLILSGCVLTGSSKLPSALEKYRDIQGECCSLCQSAFSQSPVGVGSQAARCGGFTSSISIGEECKAYFKTTPMTVATCQEILQKHL